MRGLTLRSTIISLVSFEVESEYQTPLLPSGATTCSFAFSPQNVASYLPIVQDDSVLMGSLGGNIEASVRNSGLPPPLCSLGGASCDALTDSSRPDALRAHLSIGHVYEKEDENRKAERECDEDEEKEGGGFAFHFEQYSRRRAVQAPAHTSVSCRTPDFTYESSRDQVRKQNCAQVPQQCMHATVVNRLFQIRPVHERAKVS